MFNVLRSGIKRRRLPIILALTLALGLNMALRTDESWRDDLHRYAVRISLDPAPDLEKLSHSTGNAGIYLGWNGLILTAAHVIGGNMVGATLFAATADGLSPARVVMRGRLETTDIALLQIEPALLPPALRPVPPLLLCQAAPITGQAVTIIEAGSVSHSRIISPEALPIPVPPWFTSLIPDVYTTGNSGSGLFDSVSGCLLGIMSQKIERFVREDGEIEERKHREGVAKYFVPSVQIQEFLGPALEGTPHS